MGARAAVTWATVARATAGLLVLGTVYVAAPPVRSEAHSVAPVGPVVGSTPTAAAPVEPPVLLEIDLRALVPPVAGETPAAMTPREVFLQALARSSWPLSQHELVEARVACESGYDSAETNVEGNGSTSHGLLMVNDGAHPDLAARFDLADPLQNLNAGKIVADRHRAAGLPSPWQHCDGVIAARAERGR